MPFKPATNTKYIKPHGLIVKPNALPERRFIFKPDPYGATIEDEVSGLSVTLDWNGEEVKAFITDPSDVEGGPTLMIVHKPKEGEK